MKEIKYDMEGNETPKEIKELTKTDLLKSMINNQTSSDITIVCKNSEKIHAHKIILNQRTDFFSNHEGSTIELDFEKENMMIVMEYLYTCELDYKKIDKSNLMEVLGICQKIKCQINNEKYLKKVISTKNVFEIYQKYDLENVKEFCLNFFVKNYRILQNSDEFNDLPKDLIISILKKFIKANDLSDDDVDVDDDDDLSDDKESENESESE
jgi:uncharacterized protein YktA (UPF0223 family)